MSKHAWLKEAGLAELHNADTALSIENPREFAAQMSGIQFTVLQLAAILWQKTQEVEKLRDENSYLRECNERLGTDPDDYGLKRGDSYIGGGNKSYS